MKKSDEGLFHVSAGLRLWFESSEAETPDEDIISGQVVKCSTVDGMLDSLKHPLVDGVRLLEKDKND